MTFLEVVDEDMYESLPASWSHSRHLMAGALAGMSEHCLMFPFDSIKVA